MALKLKELDKNADILIVGLGLIGGSYAKALTKQGYKVRAITRKQSDIDYAIENGFLYSGQTEVTKEAIEKADLIVLALYPHILLEWIKDYSKYFSSGTLITDVTGIKGSVVEKVQAIIPENTEFIAAHPMAGRESSGVEYSDDSVFQKANYIIVPTEKNTAEAIKICEQLGEKLGFYRISSLDIETHDRMIAFLSQLTHCIAVSLMCTNNMPGLEVYTGDSFRDLTRIAKINEEMWTELFLWNKEALLREMDSFNKEFLHLRQALIDNDAEEMKRMMRLSTERRTKFDKPTSKSGIIYENDERKDG
ncbi:MAG: prephenate dehydrogenase [Clostridiales bacterium]|nr:prephenate dehydrogenase [Clostridia bacterium]MCR5353277.1 prephenate dehydrogenase [Clostridiales bacterium]